MWNNVEHGYLLSNSSTGLLMDRIETREKFHYFLRTFRGQLWPSCGWKLKLKSYNQLVFKSSKGEKIFVKKPDLERYPKRHTIPSNKEPTW